MHAFMLRVLFNIAVRSENGFDRNELRKLFPILIAIKDDEDNQGISHTQQKVLSNEIKKVKIRNNTDVNQNCGSTKKNIPSGKLSENSQT